MDLNSIIDSLSNFQKDYSPEKLFDKISKVAKKAGIKAVYAALILYYAISDGKISIKDKVIVIGALGYFICPIDIIPDVLGPMGYTDDLAALMYALKTIWDNIGEHTFIKAKEQLKNWFGEIKDEDLILF